MSKKNDRIRIRLNGEWIFYEPKRKETGGLELNGLGMQKKVKILVPPGTHVLGKKQDDTCIYVPGNPAVSRMHLKITSDQNGNFVCDLKSLNGTFVNGVQLKPYENVRVKGGDRLSMAGSEFLVQEVKSGTSDDRSGRPG